MNILFPNNDFLIHLDLVKSNIEAKKNNSVELSNIDIHFVLTQQENNQVELIIKYDSTDQFDKPERKNGSLSNWKKEAEFFKASLSYELPSKETKYFILRLKLLKYE